MTIKSVQNFHGIDIKSGARVTLRWFYGETDDGFSRVTFNHDGTFQAGGASHALDIVKALR